MAAYLSGLASVVAKATTFDEMSQNPNPFRTRGKSREGAREEGSPQGFRAARQKIAVGVSSSREGFGVSSTTS